MPQVAPGVVAEPPISAVEEHLRRLGYNFDSGMASVPPPVSNPKVVEGSAVANIMAARQAAADAAAQAAPAPAPIAPPPVAELPPEEPVVAKKTAEGGDGISPWWLALPLAVAALAGRKGLARAKPGAKGAKAKTGSKLGTEKFGPNQPRKLQHPSQNRKPKLQHPSMPKPKVKTGSKQGTEAYGPKKPFKHPAAQAVPEYAEVGAVPPAFSHPAFRGEAPLELTDVAGPAVNNTMRREFAPGEIAGALAARARPAGLLEAPQGRTMRMPDETIPPAPPIHGEAPEPPAGYLPSPETIPPPIPPESALAAAVRDRKLAQLAARPTETGAPPIHGWEDMSDLSDAEMMNSQNLARSLLERRQAGDYRRYVEGKPGVGRENLPTNSEFMRTQDINDMLGIPVKMTRVAQEMTEQAKKAKEEKRLNLKREPIKTTSQPKAPNRRRAAEPKLTTAQKEAAAEKLQNEPKQSPLPRAKKPKVADTSPIKRPANVKTIIQDGNRYTVRLKPNYVFDNGQGGRVFMSRAEAVAALKNVKPATKTQTAVAKSMANRKKLSIKAN